MSEENLERLRVFWESNLEDIRAFVDAAKQGAVDVSLFDPEVVYEDANLPDHIGESYRGYEGVVRAGERWVEAFGELTVKLERIVGSGDHLVSIHSLHSKALSSGIEFDAPIAYAWTFRDGRVIHFQSFRTEAEALEAAGLSE
jgi:ketosteroid isomerase-like protein